MAFTAASVRLLVLSFFIAFLMRNTTVFSLIEIFATCSVDIKCLAGYCQHQPEAAESGVRRT